MASRQRQAAGRSSDRLRAHLRLPCTQADSKKAPLRYASEKGHAEVVKLLLKKGADVDAVAQVRRVTVGRCALRSTRVAVRT